MNIIIIKSQVDIITSQIILRWFYTTVQIAAFQELIADIVCVKFYDATYIKSPPSLHTLRQSTVSILHETLEFNAGHCHHWSASLAAQVHRAVHILIT